MQSIFMSYYHYLFYCLINNSNLSDTLNVYYNLLGVDTNQFV